MNDQIREAAIRLVEARAAQGLPLKVTNLLVLRRVVEIMWPATSAQTKEVSA